MANVYIVNHTIGGYYVENHSSYHLTEAEGQDAYDECMESVGGDPNAIELIRLDTETLEATTLKSWEGTDDDLEYEDDEDEGIVEGAP
jgi:hypothetical protein